MRQHFKLKNKTSIIKNSSLKLIFKAILTVDSLAILLVVYCIKSQIWIPAIERWSIVIYCIISLLLAQLCILVAGKLSKDSIEGGITEVELENESYLPSYLGYFFVALSIPDGEYFTLAIIFAILFVFLFPSNHLYYNPLFLILGYNYYTITNKNKKKILIISKNKINNSGDVCFNDLRRINEFTFIDKEKN